MHIRLRDIHPTSCWPLKWNRNEKKTLGYRQTALQDLEEKHRLDQALLQVQIPVVLLLKCRRASRHQSHSLKEVEMVYIAEELARL